MDNNINLKKRMSLGKGSLWVLVGYVYFEMFVGY